MPMLWACHVPWCSGFRPCAVHPVTPFAGAVGMGPGWSAAQAACLVAAGYCCANCGERATEAHHIIPRARGGSDDPSNLLALCGRCHHQQTGRDFGIW
jgi:5-methylcytosine-specific restriction endonuclease McrA